MHIKILGKLWKLELLPESKMPKDSEGVYLDGAIDPPHVRNKKLLICNKLKGKELIDTIVHEMIHGSDWSKREYWVNELASDIATALDRLGLIKDD